MVQWKKLNCAITTHKMLFTSWCVIQNAKVTMWEVHSFLFLFELETFTKKEYSLIIQYVCNVILIVAKIYLHKLITKIFTK